MIRLTVLAVFVVSTALAAAPVASVTSPSDFQLSGSNVVVAGVPSWPIMAGDTVVAGTSAARIRFVDGTVVNLGPHSRVAVERNKDDLSLRLVNGYLSFTLASDSALRVYSGNMLVPAQPGVAITAATGGGAATDKIVVPPPPTLPPTLSAY